MEVIFQLMWATYLHFKHIFSETDYAGLSKHFLLL